MFNTVLSLYFLVTLFIGARFFIESGDPMAAAIIFASAFGIWCLDKIRQSKVKKEVQDGGDT